MILDFFKKKNLILRLLVVGPDKDYQITELYTCWEQAKKALKKKKNLIFFSFLPSKTLYYVGEILDRKQCEALPDKREAENLVKLLDHWPVEKLIRTKSGAAPLYGDIAVVDKDLNLIYLSGKELVQKKEISPDLLKALTEQHSRS